MLKKIVSQNVALQQLFAADRASLLNEIETLRNRYAVEVVQVARVQASSTSTINDTTFTSEYDSKSDFRAH